MDEEFRKRNLAKSLYEQSNEVSQDVVNFFKGTCSEMISGFEENYIFNVDQCWLLFLIVCAKTVVTKWDKCKSDRYVKERLTGLLEASVTVENLPPYVIGKAN